MRRILWGANCRIWITAEYSCYILPFLSLRRTELGTLSFVVGKVVYILLETVQFAMLGRAIVSWLPIDENNKFVLFLTAITEPFILPVRLLLNKLGAFQNSPIDFSFFISYMILVVLSTTMSSFGTF